MFRRRRDNASSHRPPISSAWWDTPEDEAADAAAALGQPPPLPGHDPFGGWGAFPPPGDDATDAVIGQHLPPGWSVPGAPAPVPPRGVPVPPSHAVPGPQAGPSVPSVAPPAPPLPPGAHPPPAPPVPPAAQPPTAPGAVGPGDLASDDGPEWIPLLTHEHQRFQIELEEYEPEPPTEQSGHRHDMLPWAPVETPGRGRAGRLRGVRARRSPAPGAPPDAGAPPRAEVTGSVGSAARDVDLAEPAHGAPARPGSPPAAGGAGPDGVLTAVGAGTDGTGTGGSDTGTEDEGASSFPSTGWGNLVDEPDPMEAAALAAAFAADYLSWDESSPGRRGQVLLQYLPSDVRGDASLLGWSGKGRQRSEFALPGAVRPDGDGRVVVDVRVRVTPYKAVGVAAEPAYEPADEMEVAGVPSAAPAPTARGWKSLDSYWVRLAVPVVRDHGRLVVDTWDESLNEPEDGAPGQAPDQVADSAGRQVGTDGAEPRPVAESAGRPVRAGRSTPKQARAGRGAGRGRAAASSAAARDAETGGAR